MKSAPAATTTRERETAPDEVRREHARAVRQMFGTIAARYDFFNHFFSGYIDQRWRNRVARLLADVLAQPDARILDVACGTGDLSVALAKHRARLLTNQSAHGNNQNEFSKVFATDFCRPMLTLARQKAAAIPFIEGDALRLPFHSNAFDAVTIAFGLRNLASVTEGLSELQRILKPQGKLVILEFSRPVVPGFRELFNFYFKNILPRFGDWFNGSTGAYRYLSESVRKFPDQTQLAQMMRDTGFTDVTYENLTGGIAAIHLGNKNRETGG